MTPAPTRLRRGAVEFFALVCLVAYSLKFVFASVYPAVRPKTFPDSPRAEWRARPSQVNREDARTITLLSAGTLAVDWLLWKAVRKVLRRR